MEFHMGSDTLWSMIEPKSEETLDNDARETEQERKYLRVTQRELGFRPDHNISTHRCIVSLQFGSCAELRGLTLHMLKEH